MPIFDAAIFDGPPSSTIFDTGAQVGVGRFAKAQLHDTQSRGALHDLQSRARLHGKQGKGKVHDIDTKSAGVHDTQGSARQI
jgi:hypothetical protein